MATYMIELFSRLPAIFAHEVTRIFLWRIHENTTDFSLWYKKPFIGFLMGRFLLYLPVLKTTHVRTAHV